MTSYLWPDLMRELIPLNQLTVLRLFVIMASCSGIWGIKMAQPVDRAPFLAILGPNRDVIPDEVAKACVASYRTIFQKGTGNAELDAMNAAVAPKPRTFGIFNCENSSRTCMTLTSPRHRSRATLKHVSSG